MSIWPSGSSVTACHKIPPGRMRLHAANQRGGTPFKLLRHHIEGARADVACIGRVCSGLVRSKPLHLPRREAHGFTMIKSLQLRSVLTVAITLLACSLILLGILTVGSSGQARVKDQVGASMMLLADQMQDKLDRALYERAREIGNTSELLQSISVNDRSGGIRAWLDELQKGYTDYAWIGFSDLQGRVQTATGSVLEGADVSNQPWFKDGLQKVTVGDVAEYPKLSALLPSRGSTRYVAISAPVTDASGQTVGVLAAQLDWTWIDDVRDSLFGATPSGRTEEVFVLNKAGRVLLGPPSLTGRILAFEKREVGCSRRQPLCNRAVAGRSRLRYRFRPQRRL